MEKLKENWLTEGLIDFEYKQYLLLAYLQNAKKQFEDRKLYPCFSDLVFHYKNLLLLKKNKKLIYENFPKSISKADFEKLKITYEKIVNDDEVMKELEDIVHFAIPKFEFVLENGKEVYGLIEQHLEISPVGISPLYPDEGYLFFKEYNIKDTKVFKYQITIFESADEKYRGINTTYLETVRKSIGVTYEHLKIQLIKKFKGMPNPATFIVESKIQCPFEESLLPVAKRELVKHIYRSVA